MGNPRPSPARDTKPKPLGGLCSSKKRAKFSKIEEQVGGTFENRFSLHPACPKLTLWNGFRGRNLFPNYRLDRDVAFKHERIDRSYSTSFRATVLAVRDRLVDRWLESEQRTERKHSKRVYYLLIEFLIG